MKILLLSSCSTFKSGLENKDVAFLKIQKTDCKMYVALKATVTVVRDVPATHAAASTPVSTADVTNQS